MKARHMFALAAAVLAAGCSSTDTNKNAQPSPKPVLDPAVAAATAAAELWLTEVDRGDLAGSWDHIASASQLMVPKEAWVQSVHSVREPLGQPSRKLAGATYTKSIPGSPDGEYVIVQYTTHFDKLPKNQVGVETVTPMRDKDGNWRVSGYYIKTVLEPVQQN
jgi:hypothetical protein